MSEFECSVNELNNKSVKPKIINNRELREENDVELFSETNNVVTPPPETNNVKISFLDKLKDENSIKTILLIIIGYILTTSSLFKDIVEIWLPNIMTESEISLFGKVVIAALIGLSVIWFTFSYRVQ